MDATLRQRLEARKFTILLVAILCMVVVPVLKVDPAQPGGLVPAGDRVIGLLWGFVLIAAVHAVADSRRSALLFSAVGLVVFGGRLASVFGPRWTYQDQVDASGFATATVFLVMTVVMLYRAILRSQRIRGDTVVGAVCVYLLIGFAWSNLYALAWFRDNGAFNFPAHVSMDAGTLIPEFTFGYYSFVTLTTLGYGDITPATYAARTLSWVEAVVGVSYMATVIAFLISQVVLDREAGHDL